MYAVKYPAAYFDNNESKQYLTCCKACGWEAEQAVASPDECYEAECPECGSDYVVDKVVYL